jgi:hypothetical protein
MFRRHFQSDWVTKKELAQLHAFDDHKNWAVLTPEGYWDASDPYHPGVVVWAGNQPLKLSSLKDNQQPGLFAKIIKKETTGFKSIPDLEMYPPPSVEYLDRKPNEKNQLKVRLHNNGGGIANLRVKINGNVILKETGSVLPRRYRSAAYIELSLDLPKIADKANFLADRIFQPGKENSIIVEADNYVQKNESHNTRISSWPLELKFTAPGTPIEPSMYIVTFSIEEYRNPGLKLTLTHDDAKSLVDTISNCAKQAGVYKTVQAISLEDPDKPAIVETFQNLSDKNSAVQTSDTLIVIFAGHGMSIKDTYYFLGSQVNSAHYDCESGKYCVSSQELLDLIQPIPANKKVLIFDTCESGAASEALLAMRSAASDTQSRVLNRVIDGSGVHMIMGAAASRYALESKDFGHGLLTYALLEAIQSGKAKNNKE